MRARVAYAMSEVSWVGRTTLRLGRVPVPERADRSSRGKTTADEEHR
ncbi:MAG: hypothetical protein ACRDMV_10045 [Streptosporangiales bacterium]